MHDEGLQPHAQSYEFTPQHHHHQEDYGYNLKFFSTSGEDFMSNLMGTDLQTSESSNYLVRRNNDDGYYRLTPTRSSYPAAPKFLGKP